MTEEGTTCGLRTTATFRAPIHLDMTSYAVMRELEARALSGSCRPVMVLGDWFLVTRFSGRCALLTTNNQQPIPFVCQEKRMTALPPARRSSSIIWRRSTGRAFPAIP